MLRRFRICQEPAQELGSNRQARLDGRRGGQGIASRGMHEYSGFRFCDVLVKLAVGQFKKALEALLLKRPHLDHHVHESKHRPSSLSWLPLGSEVLDSTAIMAR